MVSLSVGSYPACLELPLNLYPLSLSGKSCSVSNGAALLQTLLETGVQLRFIFFCGLSSFNLFNLLKGLFKVSMEKCSPSLFTSLSSTFLEVTSLPQRPVTPLEFEM